MSVSLSPSLEFVLVTRLRAAGCVFAEDEARLIVSAARTSDELASMLDRRVAGVPLEHVLGWAEFCGLRIAVDPRVFVPRRRTAFLVEQAGALACPRAVVVDLCCGSGAVGAALAETLGDGIELYAVDIDPAAVRCARRNVPDPGRVFEGDLYEPLPTTLRGSVDVLVANAPYVPTEAIGMMPPEAREHEPHAALDGGDDGLAILRRVIDLAPALLRPGGHLLVETGEAQVSAAVGHLEAAGLVATVLTDDDLGATALVGTAPRT